MPAHVLAHTAPIDLFSFMVKRGQKASIARRERGYSLSCKLLYAHFRWAHPTAAVLSYEHPYPPRFSDQRVQSGNAHTSLVLCNLPNSQRPPVDYVSFRFIFPPILSHLVAVRSPVSYDRPVFCILLSRLMAPSLLGGFRHILPILGLCICFSMLNLLACLYPFKLP